MNLVTTNCHQLQTYKSVYNFTNTNLDFLNLSAVISKFHIFLHFYQFIHTFTFNYAIAFNHSKYDINIFSSYPVITNKLQLAKGSCKRFRHRPTFIQQTGNISETVLANRGSTDMNVTCKYTWRNRLPTRNRKFSYLPQNYNKNRKTMSFLEYMLKMVQHWQAETCCDSVCAPVSLNENLSWQSQTSIVYIRHKSWYLT
jgi:hypothetical protein